MNKIIAFISLFAAVSLTESVPEGAKKLLRAYPNHIKKYRNNKLYFSDGTFLIYDDGKQKTTTELLEDPDIEDMFHYQYFSFENQPKTDAGRIRNEAFFKKIYGATQNEVKNNLVSINWCPDLVNQNIRVTSVNNIHEKLKKISDELNSKPHLKKYLTNIAGTFNWRKISGTSRLSMHSFGMTIDLNVKFSNYWQWDCKCNDENKSLHYKNQIPKEIVTIFEKQGFIWGGNWKHYDTMHFEYRPEFF